MATDNQQTPFEDEYDSEADEDFNPEAAEAPQAHDSSSEDDEKAATGAEKAVRDNTADFDNSGDEATISKAKRKRRKLNSADANDDEGGEGGLVKTRAQRKLEEHEKRSTVTSGPTTVDVNDLWAQMSGPATATNGLRADRDCTNTNGAAHPNEEATRGHDAPRAHPLSASTTQSEPTIKIKRKIEFAGQIQEEEREVPASSAEAKLYLEEQNRTNAGPTPRPGLRRPTKRKSAFDKPLDANHQDKGKKLTTLEKSKLDWAAQVDREGLSEELQEHSRGKGDYLGRMSFLDRMNSKREGGAG